MDTTTPSPRHILTYQGATFRRAGYYLVAAVVILLIIVFVKFPPPGAVAGPPFVDLLLGFAGVVCVISAIVDTLFVVGIRFGSVKAFDENNLYCNPSVEIRNWSTSMDGLIRLFRRGRR